MYQNRKFKEIMTIFGHVGLELQALPYLHRVVSYIVTITRHPDAYVRSKNLIPCLTLVKIDNEKIINKFELVEINKFKFIYLPILTSDTDNVRSKNLGIAFLNQLEETVYSLIFYLHEYYKQKTKINNKF
jgi:hypothetical protein